VGGKKCHRYKLKAGSDPSGSSDKYKFKKSGDENNEKIGDMAH